MVGGGGLEQLQMREEDLQRQEQQRLEDRVSVCHLQPHPLDVHVPAPTL